MSKITVVLRKNPILNDVINELSIIKIWIRNRKARPKIQGQAQMAMKRLKMLDENINHIFFVGIPMHKNLGDQAQKYCIEQWIKENYKEYELVEIPTWPFYDKRFQRLLSKCVRLNDIFVIQSGYCTTSSHFDHYMHRYIVGHFKNNPVLIMPQTILYNRKSDPGKTERIYKSNKHLLFLARDQKSYDNAKAYFPETEVRLFPDIVTTLIGDNELSCEDEERDGVLLCIRHDDEKMYTDNDVMSIVKHFENFGIRCDITDTNSNLSLEELESNVWEEIKKTIGFFGKHKVVITDRYHGTIFSMISNTPVIVLATLDHKVKTGTEWFKGVYNRAYFNASSTDDAIRLADSILKEKVELHNQPFFKNRYYDNLKSIFESAERK